MLKQGVETSPNCCCPSPAVRWAQDKGSAVCRSRCVRALCSHSWSAQGTSDLPSPPSTLTPLHIWSPSERLSPLTQLRKRSSSWELRKGEEERRKQKAAFQACFRLSEVEAGGEGKGWVWKSGFLKALCTWLWESGVDFHIHPVLATAYFPAVPPLKLYSLQPQKEVIIAHYSKQSL